jgi:hypothetical protein
VVLPCALRRASAATSAMEEQHEESARTSAAVRSLAPTQHGTQFGEVKGHEPSERRAVLA